MWRQHTILFSLALLVFTIHLNESATIPNSPVPVDYLTPPPNPVLFQQPVPSSGDYQQPQRATRQLTFMQRIAGWFGYQSDDSSPVESQSAQSKYFEVPSPKVNKIQCNPCNKIPWIPMFTHPSDIPVQNGYNPNYGGSYSQNNYQQQYPVQQLYPPAPHMSQSFGVNQPQQPQQQYYPNAYYPSNGHQQFHQNPHIVPTSTDYLPPQQLLPLEQARSNITPMPLPNLSVSPIPPLYDQLPFHSDPESAHIVPQHELNSIPNDSTPQLSQRVVNQASPNFVSQSSAPKQHDPSFEIIKSVPLDEYTSSVEHPPDYIQSPLIDLSNFSTQPPYQSVSVTTTERYNSPEPQSQMKPIIVSDSVPSGSVSNASIIEEKPTNNHEVHTTIIGPTFPPFSSETISSLSSTSSHHVTTPTAIISLPSILSTTVASTLVKSVNEKTVRPKSLNSYEHYGSPNGFLDSPVFHIRNYGKTPTVDPRHLAVTKSPNAYGFRTSNTIENLISSSASGFMPSTTPIFPAPSSPKGFQHDWLAPTTISSIEKKPKQVQIIIPYTGKEFQTYNSDRGWKSVGHEFEEAHESKQVTSSVTDIPSKPTKTTKFYLTKILATNLREILKRERDLSVLKMKYNGTVDIKKLQKDIDNWTEQEYSMITGKGSTIPYLTQSKRIPDDYLTTTPMSSTTNTVESTTELPTTVTLPDRLELSSAEVKSVNSLNKLIDDNTIIPEPITEKMSSWDKLKISISPLTKEKVYVVTPQTVTSSLINVEPLSSSPRFKVRPTPGILPTNPMKSTKNGIVPELFGKLAEDTYMPSIPNQFPQGHSRPITLIES